jgi:KDO2-lipid IV(A) lauroyltransferase
LANLLGIADAKPLALLQPCPHSQPPAENDFVSARTGRAVRMSLKRFADALVRFAVVGLLKAIRLISPRYLIPLFATSMRWLGPFRSEHAIGRANLSSAFPEKSAPEIERILRGVWDNLGRVAAEIVHLERLHEAGAVIPGKSYVDASPAWAAAIERMRHSDKPALFFAAHLANWELPAVAAHAQGVAVTTLYRPPNLRAISDAVVALRSRTMGKLLASGPGVVFEIKSEFEAGHHVAMMADQYFTGGIDVQFFGRRTKVNPLLAMLARRYNCEIYGARAIRLADHRLTLDVTGPIDAPRNADARIAVQGTMQAVTSVIESWVREHPEQWLWLHRRWR